MSKSRSRCGALLLLALALLSPSSPLPGGGAAAQDAPAPDAAAPKPPALSPPQLVKFVEAQYPQEALVEGLSGTVELEVVIAPDGSVKEAKVVTPAGHGFDEAALAAVQQFQFEPARKNGEPIAARIRYPYVFELQRPAEAQEPAEDAAPEPARLEGRVLAVEDDAPLAGVRVTIATPDGSQVFSAETDAEGSFVLDQLAPGVYSIRIEREGRQPREQQEELVAGQATAVVYRMQEPRDPDAFGAVAKIAPPPREVTRRSIGKEQLTRIPGTRGDALRTVELLPGVARPPLGAGLLIVRGSAPGDTQALFEGLPVQLLYHFGGLTSFINSRFLESVDFYPGNFSVRYGRRRGGVIEARAADIPRDGLHAVADINLIDTSLLLQTPISDDAEIALAVRRSYFDLLFESVASSADISTVAAPVYYDYQLMGTYRPSDRDKLRLMIFGSSDELALLFTQPSDTDAAVAGNFDFGTSFHRAHGSWRRKLSENVDQDIDLAVGSVDIDFGLGDAFGFNLSGTDIYGRSEWRGRVNDKVRLIGGLDLFFLPGTFTYSGPPVDQSEGNPDAQGGAAFANRDSVVAQDDFTVVQPAAYIETDLNLAPVRFVIGSRVDYYDEIEEWTYDPRGSAHVTVAEGTVVKGGIGMFSQPPQFQETSPKLGNPDLEPTRTLHTGLGIEQALADGFSLGIEGFYKHFYDNVVATATGEPPTFTNDGEGRIFGLELLAKIEPRGRFFGYLSYTLMRSERNDRNEGWRLFDFDQTHILNAAAVYRLGRGWEVGGTFRLVSGNPATPIVGAWDNPVTGASSPIYGRLNSIRNPMFNRLDVRVEKQWTFPDWKLALYLDVQNVYNAVNQEGYTYDFQYRQRDTIRGLPIIPNLGLRGEI